MSVTNRATCLTLAAKSMCFEKSVLKQLTEVRYIVFEIKEPRVVNRYLWASHLCLYTHSDSGPRAWSSFRPFISFPVLWCQFSFLHDQSGSSVIFNNTFIPFNQWQCVNAEQFFLCKCKYTFVKAHHCIHPHPIHPSIVNIVTMVDCCYCHMVRLVPQSKGCAVGRRGSCAVFRRFSPLALLSSLLSMFFWGQWTSTWNLGAW